MFELLSSVASMFPGIFIENRHKFHRRLNADDEAACPGDWLPNRTGGQTVGAENGFTPNQQLQLDNGSISGFWGTLFFHKPM